MTRHAVDPTLLPRQVDVLRDLEPVVAELIKTHDAKRRLWWPTDLLGIQDSEDPEKYLADLRKRATGIPDAVRISLVMGLITEEGLPHFHRLLAVHLGDTSYWREWNTLWTAEEDRHGAVLHDYLWAARILDTRVMEEMQFNYLNKGFYPDWEYDPYRLLVYTSLQERATQTAHANNGKRAAEYDPLLASVLGQVATEEARHFHFYRTAFAEVLKRDANHALDAIRHIVGSFEMPGAAMPGFREMTDVIRRAGLYGPRDFLKIVEEQIEHWGIATLTGLTDKGREAQAAVLSFPERFRKICDRMEARQTARSFAFDVVYGREFSIG
jgi:acyl-[acyl-carrier-protein] desaturase